jgi:hypothetical protein
VVEIPPHVLRHQAAGLDRQRGPGARQTPSRGGGSHPDSQKPVEP